MKTMYKLLLSFVAIATIALFISCEGPAGPAGADGTNGIDGVDGANGADGADGVDGVDGTNGIDGTDGTPGVAGNLSCLECHTQANMDTIQEQYAQSGHGIAAYVDYTAGAGRASCGQCHNSEGFLFYLSALPNKDHVAGHVAVPTDIYNPSKIGCETCHSNHGSLEDGIEAPIRTVDAVTAIADGTVLDFGNNSNLCANCHQSRESYQKQEAVDSVKVGSSWIKVTDGFVGISSSRVGPHHGPQANLLAGVLGYGSTDTHRHTTVGCTGCHMGEAEGEEGGHNFNPNIANCTGCHATATDFNIGNMQTEFDTDMAAIRAKLLEKGMIVDATDLAVPGVYPIADFKGYWNWVSLKEDKSRGVHNPTNVKAMLATAKASLGI